MQSSSSFFLPPTTAGRVCRIILIAFLVLLAALVILQWNGIAPNSTALFPSLLLLAMLDVLALSIIAVRKRARTDRSRKWVTIALAALAVLVGVGTYAQISTYAAVYRCEFAKVNGEHGEIVVLRTFFALPEGTTAQQAMENDVPENIDEETLKVYAAYEAYPSRWGIFHDQKARVEGLAMAPFDMETGETPALLVDWEEEYARFYIYDSDPAVSGEVFVYYNQSGT